MESKEREYRAIVWTKDPTVPGKHATVWAMSLEDARRKLEEEYGADIVLSLYNVEDSEKPR